MQAATRESVAYDLNRFDDKEHIASFDKVVKPSKAVQAAVKVKSKLRMTSIASLLLVAGLLALIVMNFMWLSELTVQSSELKHSLQKLRNEAVLLQAQQDQRMSLDAIEDLAVNRLGMIKLNKIQIEYIDISNPDNTVVMGGHTQYNSYFLVGLMKSFNVVLEYLN